MEAAGIEDMQGSCDNSLRDATLPRTSLRFFENLRLPPRPAPCRLEPRAHGNLTATLSAPQLVEPFQPVAWTATRMEHRNQEKRLVAHGVDQFDRKGLEHHPAKARRLRAPPARWRTRLGIPARRQQPHRIPGSTARRAPPRVSRSRRPHPRTPPAPRRRTSDRSLAADGSQSRHDPCAGLGVIDQLDLARVERLHPADQFRNLRLLAPGVLAILIEAVQQRPGRPRPLVDRQPEQLCKMFLNPRHMESLDAVHTRGKQLRRAPRHRLPAPSPERTTTNALLASAPRRPPRSSTVNRRLSSARHVTCARFSPLFNEFAAIDRLPRS